MTSDHPTSANDSSGAAPAGPGMADAHDRGMRPAVPIMGAVFASFMVIGMALPVLSLHVHQVLGFGPFMVGLVAGCQFVASLVSRLWAGRLADTRGPKHAVLMGLCGAIVSGGCYCVSLMFIDNPTVSIALLLLGRTVMGGAESLVITGGMTWAMGLVANDRAARAIAWVGMAMFAALALGAPVGSAVFATYQFAGIALATIVLPCLALAMTIGLTPYLPAPAPKIAITKVLKAVMRPGLAFSLSGITFGSITAFLTLFFAVKGWEHGATAFTGFAVALIAARVFGGHLPDKKGGATIAFYCLGIQATGLLMIAFAHAEWLAIVGALVCGTGFSLVFPSLGLEAVRLVPPEGRGVAMATYNAFLDLTLGVVSPALGLMAAYTGLGAVFLASGIAALIAMPMVWRMTANGKA